MTVDTVLGLDLGSRNVKLAFMENGVITRTGAVETMRFYRECGRKGPSGFAVDMDALDMPRAGTVVATGYGRMAAALTGARNISEITAHYLGARFQCGLDDFVLADIGGQDYKIIRVENGALADFATNDKCAASTGRYLENMARVLGIDVAAMGAYRDDPVRLSATCAIFAESEMIGLVVRGEPVERLAAGVNRSIVARVEPLLDRMGDGPVVMAGGMALNAAVVQMLAATGRDARVLADPLHNGAIGCCVSLM